MFFARNGLILLNNPYTSVSIVLASSVERTSNYQFSYGLSQYVVVADLASTQAEAIRRCKQTLGGTASLVNITSEEEHLVINRALNAMDIDGSCLFWVGGFVNDLYLGYHKWASCEPGKCVIIILL